jgi:SOS-response transcriptional repressor LexA
MKNKMVRFEVIDYGFTKLPTNDERLQVEGDVFNDFQYGTGWSRKEALQFAMELIEEHGVEPSKELVKEMEKASSEEKGEGAEAQTYSLAVRFFYDRREEDAQFEANLKQAMEESRARRQAENPDEMEVMV